MDEYISKQAILEHLNDCKEDALFDEDMARICFAIGIFIENMKAADVQPVHHGKWEDEHYDDLLECFIATCPECGYESTDKYKISDNHRCCEYCGAKMDLKDGDAE